MELMTGQRSPSYLELLASTQPRRPCWPSWWAICGLLTAESLGKDGRFESRTLATYISQNSTYFAHALSWLPDVLPRAAGPTSIKRLAQRMDTVPIDPYCRDFVIRVQVPNVRIFTPRASTLP